MPEVGVGEANHFAAGGTTGALLRPFALRKCSDVAKRVQGIEIFGSGGIITGDNALAFINYGAKAFQICSSI
jgi:dihydropyrimidine dehydrogenase (NADP+)